jgi:hypothetical protein
MPAEIVNLRKARKEKARKEKEKRAEENRAKFGRTKTERAKSKALDDIARRRLDALKRDDEPSR